ncbi:DUF2182 domain-containing protein [Burkholderia sp. MSMB1589WGS]|uniref:copper chaperone n=1 Tax=Burkholderia sp. MSMB1589WGS TaxID=1636425 RepID=UPI0007BAB0A1|nr:DUF2182 domain-containing protein [Burkholderia sp. MSMB1589WGS]
MTSTTGADGARERGRRVPGRDVSCRAAQGARRGVSAALLIALLVAAEAAALGWLAPTPATGETPMPGGWMLSAMWTRLCGRTWGGSAASFVGMWIAMMAAMMLPSFAPMLWRGGRSVLRLGLAGGARAGLRAASVAAGYGFVWAVAGLAVHALGAALAALEWRMPALARAAPAAGGAIVLGAGALQFTAWKARHLACCRDAARCGGPSPASVGAAWRQGVRFGFRCCCCSAGLTTSLLVAGIMDWRAMAAVTAAIAVERLAPAGERAARMIGGGVAAMGAVMVARAGGLG